ncbi:PRC-barrel domain containing protein [Halosimplex marinum]|uniref:PRC-barrel domain containing protein n=1 Tax=Halosimplex marinum TaxID=3396620 RepID=UPI003F546DBF
MTGRDHVTEADVGKPVVHDGERVGRVVDYENETAFVDPNPGVTETVAAKLGVEDHGKEAFPLQRELVAGIDDETVRLKAEI